jgi:hypothetical protein
MQTPCLCISLSHSPLSCAAAPAAKPNHSLIPRGPASRFSSTQAPQPQLPSPHPPPHKASHPHPRPPPWDTGCASAQGLTLIHFQLNVSTFCGIHWWVHPVSSISTAEVESSVSPCRGPPLHCAAPSGHRTKHEKFSRAWQNPGSATGVGMPTPHARVSHTFPYCSLVVYRCRAYPYTLLHRLFANRVLVYPYTLAASNSLAFRSFPL